VTPPRGEQAVSVLRAGAQLAALCALAFAQPLFDILGKNPAFFAVRLDQPRDLLFALAITPLPLAALLAVELAVGLVSRRAALVVHLVFVAGLVAVIALQAIAKRDSPSGLAALVVAAALGVGAAVLYSRTKAVQTFITVLAVAPVVFLGLFLFESPVSKLVFPQIAHATNVAVKSRTSVVVIVFDELSSGSLMDRRGRIDAVRFPNFGSLARNATWYRNATTVHPHTEYAVPAIQDGRLPKPGLLPVLADHPNNVFTLLGHA
jgi:hypothetical protein